MSRQFNLPHRFTNDAKAFHISPPISPLFFSNINCSADERTEILQQTEIAGSSGKSCIRSIFPRFRFSWQIADRIFHPASAFSYFLSFTPFFIPPFVRKQHRRMFFFAAFYEIFRFAGPGCCIIRDTAIFSCCNIRPGRTSHPLFSFRSRQSGQRSG